MPYGSQEKSMEDEEIIEKNLEFSLYTERVDAEL